ncbi:MAG TPA: TlpA disulfide reductase family protein [Bryobacteraceae bacterium]|nr:TlpA disulfide reductase family protein [Bryobacteraceae bacterium]
MKMMGKYPISRRRALAAFGFGIAIPQFVLALDHGEPAPRFRARTLDGEVISNDSVQGKPVLFQFWTTWCQYCKRDLPALERVTREFSAQGLLVYGVNVGESKKKVKQYLQETPRESKVILMDDTNLAAVFEAKAFPLYVLIDARGNVAGRQEGSGGERALRHLLRKITPVSNEESGDDFVLKSSPRRD